MAPKPNSTKTDIDSLLTTGVAETKRSLMPMASARDIPTILCELFAYTRPACTLIRETQHSRRWGESTRANGITAYG